MTLSPSPDKTTKEALEYNMGKKRAAVTYVRSIYV